MQQPVLNKVPSEIFGHPYLPDNCNLQNEIRQQYCPYLKETCTKPRKSEPHIKVGICSVNHSCHISEDYLPVIVCPQRFKEDVMFETIRHQYLSAWNNIGWISEVNLGSGGNVDYVAITKNEQGNITDFLCVEIQAAGTTGSPYPAVLDIIQHGQYAQDSYNFGINWANQYSKTMMQQAYKKGKIISHWKRKIVFVIQDVGIGYLKTACDTSRLFSSRDDMAIDFCAFKIAWDAHNNRWKLLFDRVYSTDVEGINKMLGGAVVDEYLTEEEFIVNIIRKGIADKILDGKAYAKFLWTED